MIPPGKRRGIALAVLACFVMAALAAVVSRPRQPSIDGRTIDQWLTTIMEGEGQRLAAESAISRMGTSALPHLTALLNRRDSRLTQRVIALLNRQRLISLKPATAAEVRSRAVFGLGALGKAAVPTLIAALDDPDETVRAHARGQLIINNPDSHEVAEALVQRIKDRKDTTDNVAALVFVASVWDSPALKDAIPELEILRRSSDPNLVGAAETALMFIRTVRKAPIVKRQPVPVGPNPYE